MSETPSSIPYSRLQATHSEYRPDYWRVLRALYRGGRAIFEDPQVLSAVFPKHSGEDGQVYRERCKRAHYENYAGAVIDHIVHGLFADPAKLEEAPGDYYWDLWQDSSAPGGEHCPMNLFLRRQVTEALQTGVAWSLIDFPEMDSTYRPLSVADEEQLGATNAYIVPLPSEVVINWHLGPSGTPDWVLTCKETRNRETILESGTMIKRTYHLYTKTHWARYVVEFDAEGSGNRNPKKEPAPEDMIPMDGGSKHRCESVPMVRLNLSPDMWIMDTVKSTAAAIFNISSSLDWALNRGLYPERFEFLAPEMPGVDQPISQHQSDPDRAIRQLRGIGRVQIRGHQDRAEFLSAPSGPYEFAQERSKFLRHELYRQSGLEAVGQDNAKNLIGRTAESKQEDRRGEMSLLNSMGQRLRDALIQMLEVVADGRGEKSADFQVSGFEKFDAVRVGEAVETALALGGIDMPSSTFHQIHKSSLAKRILGADADDEQLSQIDDELAQNVAPEEFEPGAEPVPMPVVEAEAEPAA